MRYYVYQFSDKTDNFYFLASKFQKSEPGFGISILEILCVSILRQKRQFWLFGPKFAQKWVLGLKSQKSGSGLGISILEVQCALIFRQNAKFLGPNLAKNRFWGRKSAFGIHTSNIPYVSIFSQNGQQNDLNLGKLFYSVQYFGSNIIEGVVES